MLEIADVRTEPDDGGDRATERCLFSRGWGAWFDSCMACWGAMVWDAAHENPLIELMARNMAMGTCWPVKRKEARHG